MVTIFRVSGALRLASAALVLTLLTACGAGTPRPAPIAPPLPTAGLERVMGKDLRALTVLFGDPDLDIREGQARKYQFAGPLCVLDVYLYPSSPGSIPIATYVEARDLKGTDFDRASCVAALTRRSEAR